LAESDPCVVINEIAWMGTVASPNDEWIELYNCGSNEVVLEGWGIYERHLGEGGYEDILIEPLVGTIGSGQYFLLERTDDTTISDITASQEPSGWSGSGLSNSGEYLLLKDGEDIIDKVDCSGGWFAGNNKKAETRATMERIDPRQSESDPDNWGTNDGVTTNGLDAKGNSIIGTPLAQNSIYLQQGHSPTPTPTDTLTPTPTEEEVIITPENIFMTEFMPCPATGGQEWVELFNNNPFSVELIDWGLDDGVDGSSFYSFHSPVLISMYGYIDIELVGRNIFNNDGDSVELIDKNKNVVDRFTYSTCSPNWTWIRLGQSYGASWGKSNNSEPMEDSVILSSEADETITLTPTVQVSNSSVLGTVASSIGKNNFQGVTSSPSFSPPFAPVALRSVSFDQAGGSVSSESSDTAPLSPSYSNNDKKSPVWFAIPGLFIVIAGVLLVIAFR